MYFQLQTEMGTLHEVYQLKPKVINCGAILRVRREKETAFLEKYTDPQIDYTNDGHGIFSNTFVINAPDGKVRRYALYATERIIDFKEPGIYISIQDSSKNGFGSDFDVLINEMAAYLEDSLFYVIWDFIIDRYEITNGTLYHKNTRDFSVWNYNFGKYLKANYTDAEPIIGDYYADQTYEMLVRHNEMIEDGENPKDLYDVDEYEELLDSLSNYKNTITIEEFNVLKDWLKVQIADYD